MALRLPKTPDGIFSAFSADTLEVDPPWCAASDEVEADSEEREWAGEWAGEREGDGVLIKMKQENWGGAYTLLISGMK